MSSGTPLPQPVTARARPICPLCGGELRFSHREYLGGRRSARVLRCRACGAQVRGDAQDDDTRVRPAPPARKRPLPDGGQPDNFVLDPATAEMLRQALGGEPAAPDV